MRTDALDYDLPDDAIARVPVTPRDAARLLVDRDDHVEHRRVRDLVDLVGPGDVIVVNDTRVLPARVRFRRSSGGSGEVLFLNPLDGDWWEALVRPSAKLAPGSVVELGTDDSIEFGSDLGNGRRRVRAHAELGLLDMLERYGEMPLPPYLGPIDLVDPQRYQTTYARRPASAAAPTAGLHLTSELLDGIRATGAMVVPVELVIGLGTFRPISVDSLDDHEMHHEQYDVPGETWSAVSNAERVIAVGTTVARTLESAARFGEMRGTTDLFVRPPFPWRVVDVMMTNFHLPRSSLLAMVEAFVGPRWRDLYTVALREQYRFLSFGDAMWLSRQSGR